MNKDTKLREVQAALVYCACEFTPDDSGHVHLRPDLAWYEGRRCVFVCGVDTLRSKENRLEAQATDPPSALFGLD